MLSILSSLIIGGIAGWIAGKIMDSEKSIFFNIVLGIGGGFIGPFLLSLIGLYNYGVIGSIISSTVGAVLIISLVVYY